MADNETPREPPEPEWIKRRLNFAGEPQQEEPIPQKLIRRRKALAALVNSEGWPLVKEMAAMLLRTHYGAAPAMQIDKLLGYMVCNYVRDAINQLLDLIETEARHAKQYTNDDEGEVIHVQH